MTQGIGEIRRTTALATFVCDCFFVQQGGQHCHWKLKKKNPSLYLHVSAETIDTACIA